MRSGGTYRVLGSFKHVSRTIIIKFAKTEKYYLNNKLFMKQL